MPSPRPIPKKLCPISEKKSPATGIGNKNPPFHRVFSASRPVFLVEDGIFVFATQHPCFVTRTEQYITPHSYYGIAITGQPKEQCYYHRSMQDVFHTCFEAGFVIDGFYEECYGDNREIPMVIIVRARKQPRP